MTTSNKSKFATVWRRDIQGSQKEAETIAIIQGGYQHDSSREGKKRWYAKYFFKAEKIDLIMKYMCCLREGGK